METKSVKKHFSHILQYFPQKHRLLDISFRLKIITQSAFAFSIQSFLRLWMDLLKSITLAFFVLCCCFICADDMNTHTRALTHRWVGAP